MIVISAFDYSTIAARPWADAGYTCYCIDIRHECGQKRDGNIIRVGADIQRWIPPRGDIHFAMFFPPCTDVAVSGASHFRRKGLHRLSDAVRLFARCVDIAETLDCAWMIENPVSTISTYWRKPDHYFDPCDYGDTYTKKTCLWTNERFVMPPKKRREPVKGSLIIKMPPGPDRAQLRALWSPFVARAIFEANNTLASINTQE